MSMHIKKTFALGAIGTSVAIRSVKSDEPVDLRQGKSYPVADVTFISVEGNALCCKIKKCTTTP